MSSSPQEQSSTPADGLRDDELSKRFFYGGMLGLPWLWIVHAINYHGKKRSMEAQQMLREEQNAGKNEMERNDNWVSLPSNVSPFQFWSHHEVSQSTSRYMIAFLSLAVYSHASCLLENLFSTFDTNLNFWLSLSIIRRREWCDGKWANVGDAW